jgi:hypothetical protein
MRNTLFAAALAAAAIACSGCSSGATDGSGKGAATAHETTKEAFGRLTIEQLEAKMADAKAGKGALFIYDNNHKERFDQGHIPGAKFVEYDKVQASDLPQDKEATLVFYCANEH